MKKWLLIWNIVTSMLVIVMGVNACTTSDTRVDWAITQIQALNVSLQQTQNDLAAVKAENQARAAEIKNMQTYIDNVQKSFTQQYNVILQTLNAVVQK